MNTINIRNNKDNIASATVLSVSLLFVVAGLFNSGAAEAAPKAAIQKMDTIVVTATRITPTVKMETMVVTASRTTSHA
jgi:hypothetical protein